ncbi:hypothetical protein CVD28_00795 [Bacillus sp. M6-12]|uniref:hypothetical protein n=1 Tax=Bacillus sp. M6-12 TaxID=2054166 RepID=UPI000C7692C3|nr:hypothetical protein [Bacillus sp. M6-12]PLS18971.1 hypothetical protein CVD28_00795 [Bacillus sp. M6-12]
MSSVKDFLKELLTSRPELHDFYDSEQYQLSEKIIEIMVKNCMTEEQTAELLNVDLNYFLRLSSGDNTIEVSEYNHVINKLQNI